MYKNWSKRRIRRVLIILLLILTAISGNIYSKNEYNLKFTTISIEEGMSQSSAYSITQDDDGFLWIGTEDGLNRYDGYEFKIYKNNPQDPNSLSENWVISLLNDSKGNIWAGSSYGLNLYNKDKDNFTQFLNDPNDPNSISNNWINSIFEDSDGTIWIGTEGGLNRYNKETQSFTSYMSDENDPHSISHNVVMGIDEDASGTLWLATSDGLCSFNKSSETFTTYRHNPDNPNSLVSNELYHVFIDSSGYMWVACLDKGLSRYDFRKGSFKNYVHDPNDPTSIGNGDVSKIFEDKNGVLWIGIEQGGVNLYDYETETFERFLADPSDSSSISNNVVLSFYEDTSGVIWVGTSAGGINKFAMYKEKFKHIPANPKHPDGIIWNIFSDDDRYIWLGHRKGVDKYDRINKTYKHYGYDPDDPNTITEYSTWIIINDMYDKDILWFGTSTGLNKFNRRTENFTHYVNDPDDPTSLTESSIRWLLQDSEGVLWVGAISGLNKYNRDTDSFKRYEYDENNPYGLSHRRIRVIFEDSYGVFWVGTSGGLNILDREKDTFKHYKADPDDPTSISDNRIYSMYETPNKTLWIGTSGGLNRYNREEDTFKSYYSSDGLPNNTIYGIVGDANNNLWMSTNQGLTRFDPDKEEFRNYDVNDGLQSNEFNVNSFFKSDSGELFFGGINGINAFFPEDIKNNPNIPNIVITSFKKFNKPVKFDKALTEVEEIVLESGDNFWGFDFAALDFNFPEKNRYKYMLKGFDSDWIDANKRRYANYTNLGEGMYIFKVMGSNNDGIWNEVPKEIKLYVKPPENVTPEVFTIDKLKNQKINLPYFKNSFSLEFSPLDYTILDKNQQYMLKGYDKDWVDAKNKRYVHYTNLEDGKNYEFHVKNDDGEWISNIYISLPFWETWWFITILVVILLGAAGTIIFLRIRAIREYNKKLEEEVDQRTAELNEANHELEQAFEKVTGLKVQQDGDYFLTSLLLKPLITNNSESKYVHTEFLISQKKKFKFKDWESELGGDICITNSIILHNQYQNREYTVFVNGDAMGKSIQGAGGSLVLGVVFNAFVTRTKFVPGASDVAPEEWLIRCYRELQDVFISFDGTMMISVVMGIIDDFTGDMYYFNAEHPWTVLYRDGHADFIEEELLNRKIGTTIGENKVELRTFKLKKGDILIAGSDGRDDILIEDKNKNKVVMNYNEKLFLKSVENAEGDIHSIVNDIKSKGEITDDLSLLKIAYRIEEPKEEKPPYDFELAKEKALALYDQGYYESAIKEFNEALRIYEDSECYYKLIVCCKKTNKYEMALAVAEKAIKHFPGHLEIILQLALLNKRVREYDRAIYYSKRFYIHNNKNLVNLINLADSHRLRRNFDQAERFLKEAEQIDSTNNAVKKLRTLLEKSTA